MTKQRNTRGPSEASKQARNYLAWNPHATAKELSEKFKIDTSTVYRATWWKQRGQGTQEGAK